MNDPELRYQLLLSSNVQDLPSLCSVDSLNRQICKRTDFWQNYFSQHGLELVEKQDNLQNYLREFEFCQSIRSRVIDVLNVLKTRSTAGIDKHLSVLLNRPEDWKVPGINVQELQQIKMNDLKRRKAELRSRSLSFSKVFIYYSLNDRQFKVSVNLPEDYTLTETDLQTVLIRLIYFGENIYREYDVY